MAGECLGVPCQKGASDFPYLAAMAQVHQPQPLHKSYPSEAVITHNLWMPLDGLFASRLRALFLCHQAVNLVLVEGL